MTTCTHPVERTVPAGYTGLLPPVDECDHPECAAAYEGVDVVELDVLTEAPDDADYTSMYPVQDVTGVVDEGGTDSGNRGGGETGN